MTIITPSSPILEEKYTLQKGRTYLSGTQALVRLPMLQKESDQRAGLNTAGFISGYRGSPLAGYDQQLWKAQKHLEEHDIVFQPGLNEDLAATSIWGTQQINLSPGALRDGVFSLWYGKGPGADRSTDAIKHANFAGTSEHGGVLMVVGDDHAAKSSTIAHQSEHLMAACGVPVLYPSNVQEFIDFGLHGWALSRYAGLWAGLKCVTQVVESSSSVDIDPDRVKIIIPSEFEMPESGLNIRWPDSPLEQEARMLNYKWYAALEYIRSNKLNRIVTDSPMARFGIMTAGKAYQDVRQALIDLGLDEQSLKTLGIRIMKVGCVWPLDAQDARHFAQGLDEILVVEEKRQLLEYALKEELYNWREDVRPKVYGKFDARGNAGGEWSVPRSEWLLPATSELSPSVVAKAIAKRLVTFELPNDIRRHIEERIRIIEQKERESARPRVTTERKPWFCSGCPHNTSTRVPEGSRAMAGIGCHYMVQWMDRDTETFSHMGGEGAAWIGQMHFCKDKHIFANLGDGTYFHSGILAIRAAVAARANITYKVLFNDAIAMTGGQPIDGTLTVPQLAQQVTAEGVAETVVVTDEPEKYHGNKGELPDGIEVYDRRQLDSVQRRLRDTGGTTVLIYEQMCATEKRRRRKRGSYPDTARRVFINEAVCESCGDCSRASNCLSVEPVKTVFGTKRQINQSSCNKDFSCIDGFCPSFVTLEGAELRQPSIIDSVPEAPAADSLPEPRVPALEKPYRILITGVGGTGVVTIGALLGTAAHLERKGVTSLDMAGLAQKGGAVLSHVQLAHEPEQLHATHIALGEADLLLGCDGIVSASAEALSKTLKGMTRAVVNSSEIPTAAFIGDRDWVFPGASITHDLVASVGEDCEFLDASALAFKLLGDTIYTNPLLLGYAWQKGWIPLKQNSLLNAMLANGVKVAENQRAFAWGRYFAHHDNADNFLKPVRETIAMPSGLDAQGEDSLHSVIRRSEQLLTAYQNEAYAREYRQILEPLQDAEKALGIDDLLPLTTIAARQLARLMAYKDEYEVARLYSQPEFMAQLCRRFAGEPGQDYQVNISLAVPLLAGRDEHGHLRKSQFGPWLLKVFPHLARLKILRGTWLDLFGYTQERRQERRLIQEYRETIAWLAGSLCSENIESAREILELVKQVRGFGHVKAAAFERYEKQRATMGL